MCSSAVRHNSDRSSEATAAAAAVVPQPQQLVGQPGVSPASSLGMGGQDGAAPAALANSALAAEEVFARIFYVCGEGC